MTGTPSFIEELRSSARGVLALLLGDRQSTRYFDLTRRGLYGSFIAVLVVVGLVSLVPDPAVETMATHSMLRDLVFTTIPYGVQILVAYLVLYAIKRLDGFVPFLVADNWSNAVFMLVMLFLLVINAGSQFVILAVGLLSLVAVVNNTRLIVGLPTRFIIAMIGARLAANFVVAMLLLPMIGTPPDLSTATP